MAKLGKVKELIPGNLYFQSMHDTVDERGSRQEWRTVLCLKYEPWRIYKKATFLVMGQPEKPIIEDLIDKFNLSRWLAKFVDYDSTFDEEDNK